MNCPNEERYEANLRALDECIRRSVSYETIAQLAFEAGIPSDEVAQLFKVQMMITIDRKGK